MQRVPRPQGEVARVLEPVLSSLGVKHSSLGEHGGRYVLTVRPKVAEMTVSVTLPVDSYHELEMLGRERGWYVDRPRGGPAGLPEQVEHVAGFRHVVEEAPGLAPHGVDPSSDEVHDGYGHGVPEGAVAGVVGAVVGGPSAPRYEGVSLGEALESLALEGGQSPDAALVEGDGDGVVGAVPASAPEGVGDVGVGVVVGVEGEGPGTTRLLLPIPVPTMRGVGLVSPACERSAASRSGRMTRPSSSTRRSRVAQFRLDK